MFTKCPECQIAFRVTAQILQAAGGNVRCGNCDHAFNALTFLTEDPTEIPLPESGESSADDTGERLAETSKRLLDTLNELAGPENVRIEDTGIEWRVLDDEAAAKGEAAEQRYDDNTPLPDEFGDEEEDVYTPPQPRRREEDHVQVADEFSERQHDLALSEPEDWTDLLDEVMDPEVDVLEVEEELAAIHSELSGVAATLEVDGEQPQPLDLEVGETDVESELDLEVYASGESRALDMELETSGERRELDLEIEASDEPPELDLDIEPADEVPVPEPEVEAELSTDYLESDTGDVIDELEETAAAEDTGEASGTGDAGEASDTEDTGEAHDLEIAAATGEDQQEQAESDTPDDAGVSGSHDEPETEAQDDDANDSEAPAEPVLTVLADGSTTEERALEKENPEQFVPEPTEEEMTVNMEIDQELLAAAAQEEDFAATLVGIENPEKIFEQNPEEVETIIMEGEFIRSAMDKERLAAESATQDQLSEEFNPADTYAISRRKIAGPWWRIRRPSAGKTVGAIVLLLALGAQVVHYSRESLATMGFFNQTVAPVYRMLGMPVTPEWDIKGWQFEATNGSVNPDETVLTIVSRLGNRSQHPLPYPLLHVSLTDRWEDIMGSRVLEPAQYLPDDLDPSRPVQPGDNFTAVVAIQDPSVEATGFKLNVCYRVAQDTVRCAIEDFKD